MISNFVDIMSSLMVGLHDYERRVEEVSIRWPVLLTRPTNCCLETVVLDVGHEHSL